MYCFIDRMEEHILMNLVDKKVEHRTFGTGSVVSHDENYIEINFDSGTKKFVFPDVFGEFATIDDEEANKVIAKKLEKRAEIEELELTIQTARSEAVLEQERINTEEKRRRTQTRKAHPELQSVFWIKDQEEQDQVFAEWKVFVGKIKSGVRKGEPRRLARMNNKSACLITRRDSKVEEKDRKILGMFMAKDSFDGNPSPEGFIDAHAKHRIELTKEESDQMLFWTYYLNKRTPQNMTWNSGRQRYFDNLWMAQMLQKIIELREGLESQEEVQSFLEYFVRVNEINLNDLPEVSGALLNQDDKTIA